jgi:hypothetical protein
MLKALLVTFALLSTSTLTYAASQCPTASRTEFMATTADIPGIKVFSFTPDGTALLLNHLNDTLAKMNQPPLIADTVYVGFYKNTSDGLDEVGIVMFDNDCVVLGSVATIPLKNFLDLLDAAKVGREMLEPIEGA